MKLGRNVARTFLDYYKLTGYISSKPSSGLNPKPGRHSARQRGDREAESTLRARQRGDREENALRAVSEPLRVQSDDR